MCIETIEDVLQMNAKQGMQSPGKIENVKKKIYARARIGNFVWASSSEQGEVRGSCKKLSRREREAKGQMKLLMARGLAKLGKVVSGSATQGLWLGDRKMGSQVIHKGQSQHPGRGTVGKVSRGGRASNRTKKRVHRFRVRFG